MPLPPELLVRSATCCPLDLLRMICSCLARLCVSIQLLKLSPDEVAGPPFAVGPCQAPGRDLAGPEFLLSGLHFWNGGGSGHSTAIPDGLAFNEFLDDKRIVGDIGYTGNGCPKHATKDALRMRAGLLEEVLVPQSKASRTSPMRH
jgi:hypothetical protein